LVLDQSLPLSVQAAFDPASGEFDVHVRPDPSRPTWDKHARAYIRAPSQTSRPTLDLVEIQRRCPDSYEREECLRRFATAGFHYGPTFQGVERLWCGRGESLAEVRVPTGLLSCVSDYCLHPAVLDACFQPIFALFPLWNLGRGMGREIFVPVKID